MMGPPRWQVTVNAAIHLPSMEPEIKSASYQIAIEAITNAYRHSGGCHATVTVVVDAAGTNLLIDVVDDGHGIEAAAPAGLDCGQSASGRHQWVGM